MESIQSPGEDAVCIRDLTAGYHVEPVLQHVNLNVPAGAMMGILGPNGAGKTTLLRCLTGLCSARTGSVRVFGQPVGALSARERARCMAVVPQELETPMSFTVEEVVAIGRTASLDRWRALAARDRQIMDRAMVYTDVVDFKQRFFNELSGGEKQRTLVAMALAQEPRLMLLDEVTSHLDMNHRMEIMQIIERLRVEERMTVIMVSHDINLASDFCTHLTLLDQGRVAASGTPGEVLREELLSRVYQCGVKVQEDMAQGSWTISPARRRIAMDRGRGLSVHVIAGGGAGEALLRCLHLNGFHVTCGVLNAGDTDALVAAALGIPCALEKPFSPIEPAALAACHDWVDAADAVVVCGVPWGPGNLPNLDLAERARVRGGPVFLMTGVETRDYTPAQEGIRRFRELTARGGLSWRGMSELCEMLLEIQ